MPAPTFSRTPVSGVVSNENDVAALNTALAALYAVANPEDRETAEDAADRAEAATSGVTLNSQTADYTLVLADAGKVILANSASPLTVTIPPQASVAWVAGAVVTVAALGAGAVTVAAGSGVTIRSANSPPYSMPQYGTVALLRIAENEWLLTGNIA